MGSHERQSTWRTSFEGNETKTDHLPRRKEPQRRLDDHRPPANDNERLAAHSISWGWYSA